MFKIEIPSEIDSLFVLNDKSVVISETFYEAAKMFIVAHYNIRHKNEEFFCGTESYVKWPIFIDWKILSKNKKISL